MKYVAVFCSANTVADKYTESAKVFARLLVKHSYHLIWGGSDHGLMKVVASEVQKNGGKIIGVSMVLLKHAVRKNSDEMIIEKDLMTRKATILKRADAVVLLVGGIGSLDEITEMLELKKHGVHNKPIVVLNTAHFYDGLHAQFLRMEKEGFLPKALTELVFFADNPHHAIDHINTTI